MPGKFWRAVATGVAWVSLSHGQQEIPQHQQEVAPEVHRVPGSQPQKPKHAEVQAVSRRRDEKTGSHPDDEPREPQRLNREQRRRLDRERRRGR